MPVCTDSGKHAERLEGWWNERSIPASRTGVKNLLEAAGVPDARMLTTKSLGLSLSDHYWIRPEGSHIEWDAVNFFDNPFSDDIGDLLFGKPKRMDIDYKSPDSTSDGNLMKRWRLIGGRRCLVKSGSGNMQEPANEVVASRIMDVLGIDHAKYSILRDGNALYSVCEDFVTKDTELVSAHEVYWSRVRTRTLMRTM